MGFWIKVVKKEPRAKRVSTAYPFYPFTRFMHRLLHNAGQMKVKFEAIFGGKIKKNKIKVALHQFV